VPRPSSTPPPRAIASVGLVLLVVLAGCNLPGVGPTGDGTPSVTPAPVPDDEYPPGLTENGLRNATALVLAHTDALRNRSLRAVNERVVTDENGSRRSYANGTVRYGPDWSRFRIESVRGGVDLREHRYAAFANRTTSYVRHGGDGETTYERDDDPPGAPTWVLTERVRELLGAFEDATVTRAGEEPLRFRIEGSLRDGALGGQYDRVENATGVAVVDRSGVIRRVRVEYDAADREIEGWIHVRERIAVRDVGNTTVTRPGWLDEAAAAVWADRPAGLNRTRIADPAALVAGHVDALAGEKVQVRRELSARGPDDPGDTGTRLLVERAVAGAERETYFRVVRDLAREQVRTVWSNRSVAVVRRSGDGERLERRPPVAIEVGDAVDPANRTLEDVLAGLGEIRVGVQRGRYEVVAETVRDPGLVVTGASGRDAAIRNVSVRVLVGRDGAVDRVRIEHFDVESGTWRTETLRYDDLGPGDVPRPGWVSEALEGNGTRTTATAVEERGG
jgi:hypothetical protein